MIAQLREQAPALRKRGAQVLIVEPSRAYRVRYLVKRARGGEKHEKRPADEFTADMSWLGEGGELTWPVVHDEAGTAGASYGMAWRGLLDQLQLCNSPATFVIDRSGIIRFVNHYLDVDEVQVGELLQLLDDLEEKRGLIGGLDADDELGQVGSVVLRREADRTTTATLKKALRHDDRHIRAGAAAALYWLPEPPDDAVPALAEALLDEDTRVRHLAAEALVRIGPASHPASRRLLHSLADADRRLRWTLARPFRMRRPRSRVVRERVDSLLVTEERHLRVRAATIAALEVIGGKAVPPLVDVLRDDDADVRFNAVAMLGRLGASTPHSRGAKSTLGDRADVVTSALVRVLLNDEESRVREEAAVSLNALEHFAPAMLEALRDPSASVRAAVAYAIERSPGIGEWSTVVALFQALSDPKQVVRDAAHYAINHRAGNTIPALVKKLAGADAALRRRAAEIIGTLAPMADPVKNERLHGWLVAAAVPALKQRLGDADSRVRKAAREALAKIPPEPGDRAAPED